MIVVRCLLVAGHSIGSIDSSGYNLVQQALQAVLLVIECTRSMLLFPTW